MKYCYGKYGIFHTSSSKILPFFDITIFGLIGPVHLYGYRFFFFLISLYIYLYLNNFFLYILKRYFLVNKDSPYRCSRTGFCSPDPVLSIAVVVGGSPGKTLQLKAKNIRISLDKRLQ